MSRIDTFEEEVLLLGYHISLERDAKVADSGRISIRHTEDKAHLRNGANQFHVLVHCRIDWWNTRDNLVLQQAGHGQAFIGYCRHLCRQSEVLPIQVSFS